MRTKNTKRADLYHYDPAAQRHRHVTMGHILNNTIQDLLIRWKKMQGF